MPAATVLTSRLTTSETSCATGGGLVIPHALTSDGDPNPYPITILCQGNDYLSGGSDLPDATHYGSAGEYFVVEYDGGTTISIKEGATNIYDCSVPAGAYYAYVRTAATIRRPAPRRPVSDAHLTLS